jgi:serine/threonine protein kinase
MTTVALDQVDSLIQKALAAREQGLEPDLSALSDGDPRVEAELASLLGHFDLVNGIGVREGGTDERPGSDFLSPTELHNTRLALRGLGGDSMLDEWGASVVGQRVGEFTLIGELGTGGMGVVFVAEQDQPRRTVALKLVRRSAATPAMIRRFEREAHLLGRLNHPGIAQVYAAGVAQIQEDEGKAVKVPYIAMELVEGPNIRDYVAGLQPKLSPSLTITAQVCEAIQHAHQRGVIHRDLKPANILVSKGPDGSPQAKVLDFGIAREADEEWGGALTRLTGHGHLVGTLAYMSPEQARSAAEVDTRCDVYAIGAILYELLTGDRPVDVTDCALPEAARRIQEHEPKRLGAIDRRYRGDVETIVAKALMKEAARRYQSPEEMARDLRAHLAGSPIEARRDSLLYLLRRQAHRYRTLTTIAAVALLLLGAFETYLRHEHRVELRAKQDESAARIEAEQAHVRSEALALRLTGQLAAARIAHARVLAAQGDFGAAEALIVQAHATDPDSPEAAGALWDVLLRKVSAGTLSSGM